MGLSELLLRVGKQRLPTTQLPASAIDQHLGIAHAQSSIDVVMAQTDSVPCNNEYVLVGMRAPQASTAHQRESVSPEAGC